MRGRRVRVLHGLNKMLKRLTFHLPLTRRVLRPTCKINEIESFCALTVPVLGGGFTHIYGAMHIPCLFETV